MADEIGIEIDDSVRIMAAKAYLEEIQKYRDYAENCNATIEFLKQKTYSISGLKITDTKVQAPVGQKGAAYENFLMKLESEKKNREMNYCFWKSKSLSPLISIGKIKNLDYQYLLRLRYSSGKEWKEIQSGLQCENIFETRDQALLALSQVMESEGKLQKYAEKLLKPTE